MLFVSFDIIISDSRALPPRELEKQLLASSSARGGKPRRAINQYTATRLSGAGTVDDGDAHTAFYAILRRKGVDAQAVTLT